MAIAVVHSAQTPSGATSSLSITTPAAGNLLVCYFNQQGSTGTPTLTGWTVQAGHAIFDSSADSVWAAWRTATGSETSIAPTASGSGAIVGICYWELSGAQSPPQTAGSTANGASASTGSVSVTTTNPSSMVLIGVATHSGSGGQSAWTGADVATNISTTASQCFGGSYLTSSPLTSQSFTANWTTARAFGLLAKEIYAISTGAQTISVTGSGVAAVGVAATGSQAMSVTGSAPGTLGASGEQDTVVTGVAVGSVSTGYAGTGEQDSTVTGSAVGAVGVPATAQQTATVSGTAVASVGVASSGSQAISVAGTASGTLAATAVQGISVAGVAVGVVTIPGAGSQTSTVTGSAAGTLSGLAEQDTVVTGTAGASVTVPASGAQGISVTGVAVGASTSGVYGTGEHDSTVTGSAVGVVGIAGEGEQDTTVTSDAVGSVGVPAATAQTVSVTGIAVGVVIFPASGSQTIGVTGVAVSGSLNPPEPGWAQGWIVAYYAQGSVEALEEP